MDIEKRAGNPTSVFERAPARRETKPTDLRNETTKATENHEEDHWLFVVLRWLRCFVFEIRGLRDLRNRRPRLSRRLYPQPTRRRRSANRGSARSGSKTGSAVSSIRSGLRSANARSSHSNARPASRAAANTRARLYGDT